MVTTLLWTRNLLSTLNTKYLERIEVDQQLLCLLLSSLTEEVIIVVVGLSTTCRLACVGNYVQPSYYSPWSETQGWLAADETWHQTCCWVCVYLKKKNMWPTSPSPWECIRESFIQQKGRFGRMDKVCACNVHGVFPREFESLRR